MTTSKQMVTALEYLDDQVNVIYRLAQHKHDVQGLSEKDIDAVKRSINTIITNYEYIISDRYKEVKE